MITTKIMKNKYILLSLITILITLSSCTREKVIFTEPFFFISDHGAANTTISAKAEVMREYKVVLSSETLTEDVTLDYSIKAGDGLVEGKDFEIVTTEKPIVFYPGIFHSYIRILWLNNAIDLSKDNSLTITLENNSKNFTLGYPGPDKLYGKHIITKINN